MPRGKKMTGRIFIVTGPDDSAASGRRLILRPLLILRPFKSTFQKMRFSSRINFDPGTDAVAATNGHFVTRTSEMTTASGSRTIQIHKFSALLFWFFHQNPWFSRKRSGRGLRNVTYCGATPLKLLAIGDFRFPNFFSASAGFLLVVLTLLSIRFLKDPFDRSYESWCVKKNRKD